MPYHPRKPHGAQAQHPPPLLFSRGPSLGFHHRLSASHCFASLCSARPSNDPIHTTALVASRRVLRIKSRVLAVASLLHPTLPVALSPLLLFQTRIHSASVPVTHWPGAPQLSLCSFGVSPPPAAAHCEAFSESAPPAPGALGPGLWSQGGAESSGELSKAPSALGYSRGT